VTRSDVDALLNGIVFSYDRLVTPYIGVDECVNNPKVVEAVTTLCNRNLASAAGPLWNQKQVRSDGSIVYQMGGRSKSQPKCDFLGMPVKGATWDDERVLTLLPAHFHSWDHPVLLTGDHGRDRDGLARLLRRVVKPVLSEKHHERFSLTVLFKRGAITFDEYAMRVVDFFKSAHFEQGFKEANL